MEPFELTDMEEICVIVNFGLGSKVLRSAKHWGVSGGTVLLGKGTINNPALDFLGLCDVRKEIVHMITDRETAQFALAKLSEEFKFQKPNHGIAYTLPVSTLIGTRSCKSDPKEKGGEDQTMYQAITVIVNKGSAEEVVEAATRAGAKGGTIINARGSGIHETSKLFSMDIEPEKEIVLILSEKEMTDAIVSSIRKQVKIDEPGRGILYVQDANRVLGLYQQ